MGLTNTETRYGLVARVLHWLTALLILAAFPLGLAANGMAWDTSEALAAKAALFSAHKAVGVAAFAVALVRILWALVQPRPVPVQAGPVWQLRLAAAVHWAIYLSLVLVPLTGWVHHAATTGFAPIPWPFGQGLPFVPQDAGVAALAGALHGVFGKVLAGAILLHVAGALKHAVIDRDGTLARMVAGRSAGLPGARHGGAAPALIALAVLAAGAGLAVSLVPSAAPPQAPARPAAAAVAAGDWQVDAGDLRIGVTQLGQPLAGGFADWTAAIAFDPATGEGTVRVEVGVGSLALGSVTAQATGADFLDAAGHPVAVFAAAIRPQATGGATHVADGALTLRGVTVPVAFPFALTVAGDRAAMAGQVVLDRRAFGIGAAQTDERTLGFAVTVDVALTAVRAR